MPNYKAEREEFARRNFPPPLPHKLQSMRGPGVSNVILKDFCLAGPHPGSSTQEIVANLTPLLRAGVTTFVCLQPEMPVAGAPHPSLRRDPTRTVAATAKPYIGDAQAIVDSSGSASSSGGFPQSSSNGGLPLSFLHIPIPEHGPCVLPDAALAAAALELIGHMRAGEYLYIHCGDGNGRTGTLAAVLVGLVHGLSSNEALDLVQRSRADRASVGGSCPETHEQKMQVHRLLGDASLRSAAAAVTPAHSNGAAAASAKLIEAVLAKIRASASRKGHAALIYLRRYASSLAQQPVGGESANSSGLTLSRAAFGRLCNDAEWYLQPDEVEALWSAAVKASGELEAGVEPNFASSASAASSFSNGGGAAGSRRGSVLTPPAATAAAGPVDRFGVPTGYRAGAQGPRQILANPFDRSSSSGASGAQPSLAAQAAGGSASDASSSAAGIGASAMVPGWTYAGPLPECPSLDGLFWLLRGRLGARREKAVKEAFARLASSSSNSGSPNSVQLADQSSSSGSTPGFVSLAVIGAAFRPEGHPDAVAGRRSRDVIRDEFYATFGPSGSGSNTSGSFVTSQPGSRTVTLHDFAAYYAALGPCIPDDQVFEQVLSGCWPGRTLTVRELHEASRGDVSGSGGRGPASDLHRGRVLGGVSGGLLRDPAALASSGSVLEGLLAAVAVSSASASSGPRGQSQAVALSLSDVLTSPRAALGPLLSALRLHLTRCAAAATAVQQRIAGSGLSLASQQPLLTSGHVGSAATGGAGGTPAALLLPAGSGLGTGDFSVPLLGWALRSVDFDRDGRISALDLRSALAEAGAPLPDVDADLLFRCIAAALPSAASSRGGAGSVDPLSLDLSMLRLPLEEVHGLLRGKGSLPPARYSVATSLWAQLETSLAASNAASAVGGPSSVSKGPTSVRRGGGMLPPSSAGVAAGSSGSGSTGSIPLQRLMQAFDAGSHPAVSAGRASPSAVAVQVQKSFGEAFTLCDTHGPTARAASRRAASATDDEASAAAAAAAASAYGGQGDGGVRLPFWLTWAEGLSCAYPAGPEGDAAFAHTLHHLWSRGRGVALSSSSSSLNASSASGRGEEDGSGLLGRLASLSDARTGPGGSGYRRGTGLASIAETTNYPGSGRTGNANSNDAAAYAAYASGNANGRVGEPPSTPGRGGRDVSSSGGGGGLAALTSGGYAGGHGTHEFIASRRGSNAPQQMAASTQASLYPGQAHPLGPSLSPVRMDRQRAPASSGSAALDAALDVIRSTLHARGPAAMFALVRALEGACADVSGYPPSDVSLAHDALPPRVLASVLQDECSFGLSGAQMEGLLRELAARSQTQTQQQLQGDAILPSVFLDLLRGGPLPPARLELVDKAFDILLSRHALPQQHQHQQQYDQYGQPLPSSSSWQPEPPLLSLDGLRMGYAASAHPDVRAGKRSEDDVLRDFYSSLTGATFTTRLPYGSQSGDSGVSRAQWREFYACASLFEPADAAFSVLLFSTWALHKGESYYGPSTACGAGVGSNSGRAGRATGGGSGPVSTYSGSAAAVPAAQASERDSSVLLARNSRAAGINPSRYEPAYAPPIGGPYPADPADGRFRGQPAFSTRGRNDLWRGLKATGGYGDILG